MSIFSQFRFRLQQRRLVRSQGRGGCTGPGTDTRPRLNIERLEDRSLLSGNVISGYVFNDLNNNGLLDPGESGLANIPLALLNASGSVIATTVSDANGFYLFNVDNTISTAPVTLQRSASVPSSPTDWSKTLSIGQFDPALGTLTAIDLVNASSITSQIKVENVDAAPATITGTVSGSLTLSGTGFSSLVTNSSSSKTYSAGPFDGVIDFDDPSGHDFGPQTATGSSNFTITTASNLAYFIGTGSITLSEVAHATSAASGAGNLVAQINTTAAAQITVVYHYIPSNSLRPGSYTVVQTSQPQGFLDGKLSSNGTVIPGSVGKHSITIALTTTDIPHNDFAAILPGSVAGFVYLDTNDNGVKETGESGIPGVTVTLTGNTELGPVSLPGSTAADGSYQFPNLRPGSYSITESEPVGYLHGRNALGSLTGTLVSDQVMSMNLPTGGAGNNYDFAELTPGSLAGFVYLDANGNGSKDPGESGIAGVSVALVGTSDLGQSVNLSQATGADGAYHFLNLRPGNYTISASQPSGYLPGTESLGSAGGIVGDHQFLAIPLAPGVAGAYYNFGELLPTNPTSMILADSFAFPADFAHPLDVSILSKLQFLSSNNSLDPNVVAQAAFVDGLYRHVLGRPADAPSLIAWVQQLENGGSRAQVVDAVWNSAEHRGLEVDRLYATFLQRSPDAAGRAAWVNAMRAGTSEMDLARALIASAEFQAARADNASYVAALYGTILRRSPSGAELSNWVGALQNGVSRDAVAVAILDSAESFQLILNCAYTYYLNRPPDPAGSQAWLTQLQSGQATPAIVAESLLASDEFFALARVASMP
jgi:hypothetical protein